MVDFRHLWQVMQRDSDYVKTYVSYCVKSSRGESVAMRPQVWKIHYSEVVTTVSEWRA